MLVTWDETNESGMWEAADEVPWSRYARGLRLWETGRAGICDFKIVNLFVYCFWILSNVEFKLSEFLIILKYRIYKNCQSIKNINVGKYFNFKLGNN